MHALKIFFVTIPHLAFTLGGDSIFSKLGLLLQFWYFAITRKTYLRGKQMRFALSYLHKNIDLYIESIVDLAVLDEVFVQREYQWELPTNPKVIIDLGAHFGDTALYYYCKYPEAKIIALEPAPDTFVRLQKNVASIPNIIPIQVGIADTDGFANLHVSKSSIGSSFSDRSGTTGVVSVPVTTLASLLKKYGIESADLIKFDIEGAEEMLFAIENPADFSNAYIGEVHGDLMSISNEAFLNRFINFTVVAEPMKNEKRLIIKCIKKLNNKTF